MDETIIFPSPNWFQYSGLAVSKDGWLIYGGPTKSLCILKPLESRSDGVFEEKQAYHANIVNRAHKEKITSVDICKDWPKKKLILTGSIDGSVKQWDVDQRDNLGKIKQTHSHVIHEAEKEEVVGVQYSNEPYAVTAGFMGNIVKWDLNSNVAKNYNSFLRGFKPSCIACSQHMPLHVAVGTRQGVVFVLDLNNNGKLVYKVRSQDEELVNLSWCPQYEVAVRKSLVASVKKSNDSDKSDDIEEDDQTDVICLDNSATTKSLPEDSFCDTQDDLFDMYKDHEDDTFGHKKFTPIDIVVKVKKEEEKRDFLEECAKLKEKINQNKKESEMTIANLVDALNKTSIETKDGDKYKVEKVNQSTATTTTTTSDKTLQKKTTPPKPTSTVSKSTTTTPPNSASPELNDGDETKILDEFILQAHKHLLASISKHGEVKIWSQTGKLIANCNVPSIGNKLPAKNKKLIPSCNTILWYKPDILLISDAKSQLLEANPLHIDRKNRVGYSVVHSYHKRGLYGIFTNAPRVQFDEKFKPKSGNESDNQSDDKSRHQTVDSKDKTSEKLQRGKLVAESHNVSMVKTYNVSINKTDANALPMSDWKVWTVAQDRFIICYSMEKQEKLMINTSCGGFIYNMHLCPYDAKRLALSVGDGAIRVWDAKLSDNDEKYLSGSIMYFWQNVQGKVLTVAWHPTKENLLAFATAESRLGVIDASKTERAAKNLLPVLSGSVYSIAWGEDFKLYAVAGGEMVMYDTSKPEQAPTEIPIEFENKHWQVSGVYWYPMGILVGSNTGAVAVLDPNTHKLLSARYVHSKMIHCLEWHPQQVTESNDESQYKDLIAVSSLDKKANIVVLEYVDKEDGLKLHPYKLLSGHTEPICQMMWNPHKEGILLSTSYDSTVRVWDISEGAPIAIFGGHTQATFTACWCPFPNMPETVMSGGADCCLRMWKYGNYPAAVYLENHKNDFPIKKERKKKERKGRKIDPNLFTDGEDTDGQVAACLEQTTKAKGARRFLLPTLQLQVVPCSVQSVRKMAQKYLQPANGAVGGVNRVGGKNGNGTEEGENGKETEAGNGKATETGNGKETEAGNGKETEAGNGKETEAGNGKETEAGNGKETEAGNGKETEAVNGKETEAGNENGKEDGEAGEKMELDSSAADSAEVDFLKLFGTTNDLNEFLDFELNCHLTRDRIEAAVVLCLFRGHMEAMVRLASERDALCPFIMSLAPCVSFKYWKSVSQLYLSQIDRLVAKRLQRKVCEPKNYGGHIYRKVAHQLSVHDLMGAVSTLTSAKLFKEAFVLAKARHMDSIALDILSQWTAEATLTGNSNLAAICNLAIGDVFKASLVLSKSDDTECLALAAELAKVAGQPTFADHIEEKLATSDSQENGNEALKALMTKAEAMLEESEINGGGSNTE